MGCPGHRWTGTFALLGLAALATTVRALLTTDPTLVRGYSFHYVVVGGGTAGLVLAARLSEVRSEAATTSYQETRLIPLDGAQDPTITVAVIEAGGDGQDIMQRI